MSAGERVATLEMDGWAGRSSSPCVVVGETPKRYRVRFDVRTRIAGRMRYAAPGEVVLIPKRAIRFKEGA